jgi:hypothetical protein
MDIFSVITSIVNVGSTAISGVSSITNKKYYLEQNLIPLQIYMDDISDISQKISNLMDSESNKYKCRLDDLHDKYRRLMGFDRFVMVKTQNGSFKLFEALMMEFDVGEEAKQMLLEIITKKSDEFEIENGMKLIVTNGDEADEIIDKKINKKNNNNIPDSLILTYSETQIKCYYNQQSVGETAEMDKIKINEILQKFRTFQLNRVYVQTYKSESENNRFMLTEIPNKYKWVDKKSIYRGAYKPLSPLTCHRIQNSRIKSNNYSAFNTEYAKALFSQWNELEYIYIALKTIFEEINLRFTLQLAKSADENKNSIDELITDFKKLETPQVATRESAEHDRDKDANFRTFVKEQKVPV